ncbi:MAG TPA: hypothetical protein DCP91_05710 [Eggerthellaceae bacterium]|nr:hypothetical protein [Eggerthellaceae bacterium]
MAANNTADVTNVKGVAGGYGYSAPYGTDGVASSNPFEVLGDAYDNMGFISSDGIEEAIDADTEEITDLNGEVVFVAKSREVETLVLTLISLTEESLNEMYGHSNVDASGTNIVVQHKNTNHDQREYVYDLVLKDGRKMRKVVPNGTVTEVGSIVYGAGNVFSRQITIQCAPDSSGVRMYDYIQKAA